MSLSIKRRKYNRDVLRERDTQMLAHLLIVKDSQYSQTSGAAVVSAQFFIMKIPVTWCGRVNN